MRPALRSRATALGLVLLLGGVAACSSAPLPAEQLAVGGKAPSGTVIDPSTGQTVDAVTGQVVDAVTGEPVPAAGTGPDAPVRAAAPGAPGAPGQPAAGGQAAPGGRAPGAQGAARPQRAAVAARSTLFTAAEDRIGITSDQITLCGHAALIFGKAFNARPQDLDVFFRAMNAERGGLYGRKIAITLEDDKYSPTEAVTAARACKGKKPFILLGGIGFDQIPAVRNYVEAEHIPYLHHTATVKGSQGLKYSFTALPTVERTGEAFAQLYLSKYKGKKLGIIKREGVNWEPGVEAFKQYLTRAGVKVTEEVAVPDKKGNYTQDILKMKDAGVEVVWGWENALASTQIVRQAENQGYRPKWLLFPFNLTTQTLADTGVKPPMDGVAMYTAYSQGDYKGPFAQYADDIKQFEEHYRKYDADADLKGVAGDLLFLNWQAQKSLYDILLTCGKDCTRNRFVDTVTGYRKRPSSSACLLDFTRGDRRHGADSLVFMETYDSPSGRFNWRNTKMCVGPS